MTQPAASTVEVEASIRCLKVIDTDSHISEPLDLWSSRAPAGYRDRLPRVVEIDGERHWVVDSDVDLGKTNPTSVVARPQVERARIHGLVARGPCMWHRTT